MTNESMGTPANSVAIAVTSALDDMYACAMSLLASSRDSAVCLYSLVSY